VCIDIPVVRLPWRQAGQAGHDAAERESGGRPGKAGRRQHRKGRQRLAEKWDPRDNWIYLCR